MRSMEGHEVRSFAQCMNTMQSADDAELAWCWHLAGAVERFQRAGAREDLAGNCVAALMVYQCDGWATDVLKRVSDGVEKTLVLRDAKCRLEFLLEHVFLRLRRSHGSDVVTQIAAPARQVDRGKAAWHQFSATCDFVALLRNQITDIIAISMNVQDGLNFSSVSRLERPKGQEWWGFYRTRNPS